MEFFYFKWFSFQIIVLFLKYLRFFKHDSENLNSKLIIMDKWYHPLIFYQELFILFYQ